MFRINREAGRILRGMLEGRQPRSEQRFEAAYLLAEGFLTLDGDGPDVKLTDIGLREAWAAKRATDEGTFHRDYPE